MPVPKDTRSTEALLRRRAMPSSPARLVSKYLVTAFAWRLGSFVAITAAWALASALVGDALPGPGQAMSEIQSLLSPRRVPGLGMAPTLFEHIGATAIRAYAGLALGLILFTPLGVVLGMGRFVYSSSIALVEFARSVPAFMLILLLLALRISGEPARIVCIVWAVGALMMDYAATATRNVPTDRLEVFRLMRASRWTTFWRAMWVPILLNALVPALRIGVGISLVVALVVETLIQPQRGLGVLLNMHMGRVDIAGGLALVVVTGLLGWLGNLAVTMISDLLWWRFAGRPLDH
jgi:ABC-type nitrate/sulfonate/bicarbonate transport system permease component